MVLDLTILLKDINVILSLNRLAAKLVKSQTIVLDFLWSRDSKNYLLYQSYTYVSNMEDLYLCALYFYHNYMLAGYLGQTKILQLLQRKFAWSNMKIFVIDFMRSCNVYNRNKLHYYKLYSLLKQLLILSWPWKSISIDFVEQFLSSDNFTNILVIVDYLTKQGVFIPIYNTIDVFALVDVSNWLKNLKLGVNSR